MNVALSNAELQSTLPSRPAERRRTWSFLVCVVVPTLLALIYLSLVASPQFVTEFRFSVITVDGGGSSGDAPGQSARIAPLSIGPVVQSDHMVVDYLDSRQLIDDLRKRFNLAAMFHSRISDPLLGFWWDNGTPERLLRYWRNFVLDTGFDTTTGLGHVAVRAYTPQDSLKLSQALVELCENLVNDVSMRPRLDAVRFAEASANRAQKALDDVTSKVAAFRNGQQTPSPGLSADAQINLASQLQVNLAGLKAQQAALDGRLGTNAPSMVSLRRQIAAAEAELANVQTNLGHTDSAAGGNQPFAQVVIDSKTLDDQAAFALQFRNTAVLRLEQARYDAEVQHDYMQVHVRPSLAQAPAYPRVFTSTFLVFAACFVMWSVGILTFYAMRDYSA